MRAHTRRVGGRARTHQHNHAQRSHSHKHARTHTHTPLALLPAGVLDRVIVVGVRVEVADALVSPHKGRAGAGCRLVGLLGLLCLVLAGCLSRLTSRLCAWTNGGVRGDTRPCEPRNQTGGRQSNNSFYAGVCNCETKPAHVSMRLELAQAGRTFSSPLLAVDDVLAAVPAGFFVRGAAVGSGGRKTISTQYVKEKRIYAGHYTALQQTGHRHNVFKCGCARERHTEERRHRARHLLGLLLLPCGRSWGLGLCGRGLGRRLGLGGCWRLDAFLLLFLLFFLLFLFGVRGRVCHDCIRVCRHALLLRCCHRRAALGDGLCNARGC